jgi:hypothetical protein
VFHHGFAAHPGVPLAQRERVSGAGRRQGLEAEASQQPRCADVPWVRDDEGMITLMQGAKRHCFFRLSSHFNLQFVDIAMA